MVDGNIFFVNVGVPAAWLLITSLQFRMLANSIKCGETDERRLTKGDHFKAVFANHRQIMCDFANTDVE